MNKKVLKKATVSVLTAVLLAGGLQAPAQAGMVGTAQVAEQAGLEQQRDSLRELVAREDVRAALRGYGVDDSAVAERIANMSSAELQSFQARLDKLPAGADSGVGLVLGIIFIFIVLDLLGATDVFPRI